MSLQPEYLHSGLYLVSVFYSVVRLWEMTSFTMNNQSFMLRKIIAPAGYRYSGQRGTDTGKGNTTNGKYNLDPVSSLNNRYRPSTIFLMWQDCQMSFLTMRIKRPSLQFQTAYIIEHLLCDRHYTEYLISIILFNSHPQSVSYILLLNPIL